MLKSISRYRHVTPIIVILVASCTTTIEPFDKEVLHESSQQEIIVKNRTSRHIHLIAVGDAGVPVGISPGGEFSIPFVITTRADLADSAQGVQIVEGSRYNEVKSSGTSEYFAAEGEDWRLRFRTGIDEWNYLFVFGDCWSTGPAPVRTHDLEVSGLPPLVPEELCP